MYNVHVLGFNSFGDGRPSAQTIKTLVRPVIINPNVDTLPPPFYYNGTGKSGRTILIQWEEPLTNKKITAFKIEYEVKGSNQSFIVEVDGSTHELLLTDLKPFTEYTYRIQSVGTLTYPGPFSPTARAMTLEDKPSDPPSAVQASPVNSNTVEVSWRPPAIPNGIITRYTVMYQRDPSLPEESWEYEQKDGSLHHSTIESLTSDTKYYFKVRAGTQAGDGPPTDAVAAQTLPVINKSNSQGTLQQGILIGVCLSLVCICICTALITYRFRHVLWRRRSRPTQCSCRSVGNSGPCVHYHSNGYPQRVYMSVPNSDEMGDTTLPVLTCHENSQEGTPPHFQNGSNWYHTHLDGSSPVMNGHGPPGGNGLGPLVGNGHCSPPKGNGAPMGNGHGPPRMNGHGPPRMNGQPGGLVGWQKREGYLPQPPREMEEGCEEERSHSGSSAHGSGLLNHSQEYNSQEMPCMGTEHQEVIPLNSSTSQAELSGTNSLTSLQSTASLKDNSMKDSSQDSITILPPTFCKVSASITPPSQGHISGAHSSGTGISSDGDGIATPSQTATGHRLPPARCVDPQRVSAQGHVMPVSCGRGSPPSGAQDPHGADPWERWTPPKSEMSCPREAEEHMSEETPIEPNRTVKTCTV
ncbi:immunoglobulin superfamily DCC subclass member 4-like [Lytechinus pictus]|uniref:immunoglobulin superfamily DCC subclass member 4-like n=1 Tax=Lytechinus pictus TaxID=7653 RepID=UPI0030B9CECE